MKDGPKAEADLSSALPWISDPKARESTLLVLGQNREQVLGEDDKALEAYNLIVKDLERFGGSEQFGALQGIARIQTRKGQFDEALKTLNRANPEKLQGTWKKTILQSIDDVNEAKSGNAK